MGQDNQMAHDHVSGQDNQMGQGPSNWTPEVQPHVLLFSSIVAFAMFLSKAFPQQWQILIPQMSAKC